MDLIEAMGQELTGLNNVPSMDMSAQELVEILVATLGSGRAAARALGVGESTLRGWRKGARPRKVLSEFVATARGAASRTFKGSLYDQAYHGDVSLVIEGWIRKSNDYRKRKLHVGRYIPRRSMQSVLRAWSAGDDDSAARRLYHAIDTYYEPLAIDIVTDVYFE